MQYKIPLFKLNFGKEEEREVLRTLNQKWISTGPKTIEFENKFSEMLNIKYSVAMASCTAALHLALKIAGIKKSDEVIVPSLTFVATANAVCYVDAIPVFCDIKSLDDLTMDPKHIEQLISSKTKAIIVMHYGGYPCDMKKITKIAKKHNLKVIEDASHAPLSEYGGRKLGTIGDIGCFSFFSNKNISTAEGGMLVTNNRRYFEKAKLLRSHGMTSLSYDRSKGHSSSYDVVDLGYNYRYDDIRASLGIAQLRKLKSDLKKRVQIRNCYLKTLSRIPEIIIPFANYAGIASNYIFPIVLKNSNLRNRNKLREILQLKGVQTSIHYPAVHRFSIYRTHKLRLPKTEYVSDNEITLPMYSSLREKEIKYICSLIEGYCIKGS